LIIENAKEAYQHWPTSVVTQCCQQLKRLVRHMAVKKAPKRSTRSRRRARAAKNTETIKASDRELLAISKPEWAAAKRKERIVKIALRSDVEAAAESVGCSTRTIRRLVASFEGPANLNSNGTCDFWHCPRRMRVQ
jgi:hypothetical protein